VDQEQQSIFDEYKFSRHMIQMTDARIIGCDFENKKTFFRRAVLSYQVFFETWREIGNSQLMSWIPACTDKCFFQNEP